MKRSKSKKKMHSIDYVVIVKQLFILLMIIVLILVSFICANYYKHTKYEVVNHINKMIYRVNKSEKVYIKYPYYNLERLDQKIAYVIKTLQENNNYIACEGNNLDNKYINLFCQLDEKGNKNHSFLISTESFRFISINKLFSNYIAFISILHKQIDSKYPSFIAEALKKPTVINSFQIKNNEFIIYFDNYEIYPLVPYKFKIIINFNELKNNLLLSVNEEAKLINKNIDDRPEIKYIAFTFDDGPHQETTPNILDTLKSNKAQATFFMTGYLIESNAEIVKRVINENNEIGNHSYSHKRLTKLSKKSLFLELDKTNLTLFNITNTSMTLLRPPYGSMNEKTAANISYPMIYWSIDTNDWKNKDAKAIYNEVITKVKPGDIVLMHDSYTVTIEALKIMLPELYVRGYQVVTVSELAKIYNTELLPGKRYRFFTKKNSE